MKREEMETFIREVINHDPSWENEYEVTDETVKKIADRWEEDVDAAREDGIADGRETWDPHFME